MIDPKKLKEIEVAQNKLFKKFGVTYRVTIGFPKKNIPIMGRLAVWLLDRIGAKLHMQVVETRK